MLLAVLIIKHMWNIAVTTFSMAPRRSLELRWRREYQRLLGTNHSSHCHYPYLYAPNDLSLLHACYAIEVFIIYHSM
jgi:hypothetical protein